MCLCSTVPATLTTSFQTIASDHDRRHLRLSSTLDLVVRRTYLCTVGDIGFSSVGSKIMEYSLLLTLVLVVCVPLSQCDSLSEQQINETVSYHNMLRKNEGAADMKKMKWNPILAEMASNWADNCDWKHGHPQIPKSPFGWTGQNLYILKPTPAYFNLTNAIQNWFNEKQYYDFNSRNCSKVCGHYTQVVWANSSEVGCAVKGCPLVGTINWTNSLIVVCNYGPGGNYAGRSPYIKDTPCSKCTGSCSDGLCD